MNIIVITHTAGNRPGLLQRCKRSVSSQLEDGDRHMIITTSDLMQARWDSLQLGDIICWVDDDDYLLPNAIRHCKNALITSGAGIAFTNEAIKQNSVIRDRTINYSDVITSPSSIHHLAMFKTSLVDEQVFNDFKELGIGLEWLIKGYVALKYGAIHVQMNGYFWTQDQNQHSRSAQWINSYQEKFFQLQDKLTSYAAGLIDCKIPTFVTNYQCTNS